MSFVIDASVVLAWILGEPETDLIIRARRAADSEHLHVPANWPLEMVNILLMAARRRRVQERELARLLQAITTLPVTIHVVDVDLACGAVALLGKQHELTAYDASYLELALRLGVPLATQDDALVRAAAAAGAALF